jgi:hypothetical protein
MSAVSEVWTVRKSVTDYEVSPSGSVIVYRPNGFSEATMVFDNSDGLVTNIFVEEDTVSVKIGTTTMLDGFISSITTRQNPNRSNELILRIVDYGGYLAGKTIFESEYKRTLKVSKLLSDADGEIAGTTNNITGLDTSSEEFKKQFLGTYVRDALYYGVDIGGGDYFYDESKVLQAFARESRNLEQSPSNQYRIRDIAPSLSRDLIVDHKFPYEFTNDVTQRFRKVVVTSGVLETYPPIADELQLTHLKDDYRGKDYSLYFNTIINQYDIDTTEIEPVRFEPATDVGGGLVMPTVKILSSGTGDTMIVQVRPITRDDVGSDFVLESFNIDLLDYQRIGFFIKHNMTGATLSTIKLRLDCGGGHWEREIYNSTDKGDLDAIETISGTGFTYVEYALPANLIDDPSPPVNGWDKVLSPDGILTQMFFDVSPTTGYNANSFIQIGKLHFYRRRRGSDSVGGSPATEKIIVDSRNKGQVTLETQATKELARANVVAKKGQFTIDGNKDFNKPAYMIDIDFSTTLGTGRSGQSRIREIRHHLQQGVHKTTVFFNNSFQRL